MIIALGKLFVEERRKIFVFIRLIILPLMLSQICCSNKGERKVLVTACCENSPCGEGMGEKTGIKYIYFFFLSDTFQVFKTIGRQGIVSASCYLIWMSFI